MAKSKPKTAEKRPAKKTSKRTTKKAAKNVTQKQTRIAKAGARPSAKAKKGRAREAETLPLFDDLAPATATIEPVEAVDTIAAEPTREPTRRKGKKQRSYQTAQTIASRQREISISEFFAKNRHLLGFDSLPKALLTAVKEAVDNSLDA